MNIIPLGKILLKNFVKILQILQNLLKDFVVMNQDGRKAAETIVEKDFYKLLNNSNFGYGCRKNIDNCNLELLYDRVEEVRYIKKYADIFTDHKLKEFFTGDALREQIEKEIDEKINEYEVNDEFYLANEAEMQQLREEELEAIDGLLNKRKRTRLDLRHRHVGKKIDKIENEIKASEDL